MVDLYRAAGVERPAQPVRVLRHTHATALAHAGLPARGTADRLGTRTPR